MQLSFRGVNYDYSPSQAFGNVPTNANFDLKFRGANYRLNQQARAEKLNAILKFRGVSYNNNGAAVAQSAETVAAPQEFGLKYRGTSYRQDQQARVEKPSAVLKYRGISYNTQPDAAPTTITEQAEAATPEVFGLKYRGTSYRLNEQARIEKPSAVLKYRGISYNTQPDTTPAVDAPVVPAAAIATSMDDLVRGLAQSHHRSAKQRQQALLNRTASQAGLNDVAIGYWNHIQGKLHPSFLLAYDRSGAALS